MKALSQLITTDNTQLQESSDLCKTHNEPFNYESVGCGSYKRELKWCDSCETEKEAHLKKFEDRKKFYKKKEKFNGLFPSILDKKKYSKVKFSNLSIDHEKQGKLFQEINDFVKGKTDNRAGYIFSGGGGEGKTYLSCAIARAFEDIYKTTIVTRMNDIFLVIAAQVIKKHKTEEELLNALISVDLLVLDEIELHRNDEKEFARIQSILSYRDDDDLPTIITTNLGTQDTNSSPSIKTYLGNRIINRFKKNKGRLIACDWPSYRM